MLPVVGATFIAGHCGMTAGTSELRPLCHRAGGSRPTGQRAFVAWTTATGLGRLTMLSATIRAGTTPTRIVAPIFGGIQINGFV